MTLKESFASCKIAPATIDEGGTRTSIVPSGTSWETTSFFNDSSGRSTFDLPILLSFPTKKDLDVFLAAKCLDPPPKNLVVEDEGVSTNGKPDSESSVGFEIKSQWLDETKEVCIEDVSVLGCSVEDLNVRFQLEVTVRASNHHHKPLKDSTSDVTPEELSVMTSLEITPVLTTKTKVDEKENGRIPDRSVLEVAAIPNYRRKTLTSHIQETRLDSFTLALTLTHAFTIFVRSVQGPSTENTLISLTIRHSKSHPEPVTISDISLHTGHSRFKSLSEESRSMPGGQFSVTNMTKYVHWGYAPKTKLDLPLTLRPNDAYSTILTVNASEEMQSRAFISPVSVTGSVGGIPESSALLEEKRKLVVGADAHWSTALIAVEPTDAFRIDMDIQKTEVVMGEPMVLSLRIFNLGVEACDLMLLMAKEGEDEASLKHRAVNTAIISEVDGYKFGVWGISGEDDGTIRLTRDCTLLAIDAALMLGKIEGQHAVEAELRFVPLREGRLDVPNWKFYDRVSGNWYTCVHNLKVVAKQRR